MKKWYAGMEGKTVLITGGSKGIGKGCAKVFCNAGAHVVICSRNSFEGEEAAAEISRITGGDCRFIAADISKQADVKELIDATVKAHGKLDCLINNAGYYMEEKPLDELTLKEMQDIFAVNFFGLFLCCKYALPFLRKSKGSIINMSSVIGHTGQEGAYGYTATKGAINSFTRSLAIDETKNGVRINAVLPGHINTELYEKNKERAEDPDAFEQYSNYVQWIRRGGESEEIGKACFFLASDLGSFVTGIELFVTGGYEIGEGYKTRRLNWKDRMKIAE